MQILIRGLLGFVFTVAISSCTSPRTLEGKRPIEFALIGDVPYSDHDAQVSFPNMIREINRADVAFVVHDGDLKSGGTNCSEEILEERRKQFDTFEAPFVFIYGDNEWTDCPRNKNNRLTQEQWLEQLRRVFSADEKSLGKYPMRLERQSEKFTEWRENVMWRTGEVLFVGLNMPGDKNNYGRPEYAPRNRANLEWMREAFREAQKMRALMIIIQANPHFDLARTNQLRIGFNEFIDVLEEETIKFRKPVVLVHGDSHYFRIDKPLIGRKSKRRLENFTRVETFGNPDVHWVHVTIDPADPEVFIYRPRIIRENVVEH